MPEVSSQPQFENAVEQLLGSHALERLRRLDVLAQDELVRQYRSLWASHRPPSGSPAAAVQGACSQQRGAAVEALAEKALEALARQLNEAEGASWVYRVVTSLRVPASIPANPHRAKSEWDVVLLRRANPAVAPAGAAAADATIVWDVCLLVEAKASVEAATTDLPRLLRGLRLLAHAEEEAVYPFETRQGVVRLRGASLRALKTDEAGLKKTILYCCDAPAEDTPRLLSAASRMQLLSAQASLAFAGALAQKRHADPQSLGPVWRELLESPQWRAVLNQYPTLRQVRELMVHIDDLATAVDGLAAGGTASG